MLDRKLCQRLITAIKLLVKENTMMPVGFQFKGKCMLAEAQKKLKKNQMENNMALQLKKRILEEKAKVNDQGADAKPVDS